MPHLRAMLALTLQLLASCLYVATAGLALRGRGLDPPASPRALFACGLLAVDLHAIGYALRTWGQSGPELHFFAALSLVALGMGVLTLADSLLRRVTALQVVVMPLAAIALLPHALLPAQEPAALHWQIQLHAWTALLAYAALSVGAVLAVLLWLQERGLRNRRPSGVGPRPAAAHPDRGTAVPTALGLLRSARSDPGHRGAVRRRPVGSAPRPQDRPCPCCPGRCWQCCCLVESASAGADSVPFV
jgi:hypothetical protein